jgi:hypothetical protein
MLENADRGAATCGRRGAHAFYRCRNRRPCDGSERRIPSSRAGRTGDTTTCDVRHGVAVTRPLGWLKRRSQGTPELAHPPVHVQNDRRLLPTDEGMTKPLGCFVDLRQRSNCSTGANRRTTGEPPSSPVTCGRERGSSSSRQGGLAARRPRSSRPPQSTGADRDVLRSGSTNAPAKGQQPVAAGPTAGCGVVGAGHGYPDHVGALLFRIRVLGIGSGPLHGSAATVAPPGFPKPVDGATSILHLLINVRGHPTVPPPLRVDGGVTCRHHGCRHAKHPRGRSWPGGPSTPNRLPWSRQARADLPPAPAGREAVVDRHAHHLPSDLRDRDRTTVGTGPPTHFEVGIQRQARMVGRPSRRGYKAFTLQTTTDQRSEQRGCPAKIRDR